MHILSTIFEALPYILEGTFVTVLLVVGALFVGFCLGVPMAVAQVYGPKPAARLVSFYVWFFRGVPVLLLLFLFYYGLFGLIGIEIGTIGASCLVLGMTSAAYQSQIFRGSIQS
ncbi:MAG: ABC transporter permease subunit, partial [Mailhella sp.]|nr:ABC transporter permease subunit [Mailhella sp.]